MTRASLSHLALQIVLAACATAAIHCDSGDSGSVDTTAGSTTGASGSGAAGSGATTGPGSTSSSSAAAGGSGGAGGAGDPCAGRLLCDDFEDDELGAAPAAPWSVATNNGSVAVDDEHTHSGSRAVKVRTETGQYKQALFFTEGAPALPVAGNVVYGRMMIYMDQAANDGVHWTMIQGSGPLDGQNGVTAHYRYGGMWQGRLMANYETWGAATDCWDHSETAMPTGQWSCMEWRFDGPNNEMQFWLDGQEITDIHVTDQGEGCGGHDLGDQWLAPTFERMSLGWESYQQDDAREAWIDDVILDDEPVGCPP